MDRLSGKVTLALLEVVLRLSAAIGLHRPINYIVRRDGNRMHDPENAAQRASVKPRGVDRKRVSIVINNYNYERFLRQAIESALSQTYENTEVIIVDDGSTDGSVDIINEYAERATVILKNNGGQASAFNVGISRATGDFILLLDSDDYLFPDAAEVCVEEFPPGYSRICFRLGVVDDQGNQILNPSVAAPFMDFDGNAIAAIAEGRGVPAVPTSGNVFDAQRLKAILPIPEDEYRICADGFVFIRTAVSGDVRSLDRELGAYRVHGSNHFNPNSPQLLTDKKRLATHIDNYYKMKRLREQACIECGLSRPQHTNVMEEQFYPLHMHCAGYANRVDSPHLSHLTKASLSRSIGRYLVSGDRGTSKRVPQAVYLLLIVWLPERAGAYLMRLKDELRGRWRGSSGFGHDADGAAETVTAR
jgi:glycosyltransferase involved in cell wall biosynthesis